MDAGTGLVSGRKRKGSVAENQREKKEICLGILWISQLSLSDDKRALKEVLNEAFICCSPACSRALEFKFHRRDPLLLRETCSRRDDRQLKPPGKGAERREERRAAVADLTEARNSNGGGRAVAAVRRRRLQKNCRRRRRKKEGRGPDCCGPKEKKK